ncbi:MAG: hypothetical protein ABEJ98_03770 [Candidatus Nanohaloarchaea archaeon]
MNEETLRWWRSLLLPLLEASEEEVKQVEDELARESILWVRRTASKERGDTK